MNTKVKSALIVLKLIIVLGVVNGAIFRKQAIVNSGRTIFLELAPVDPRSLMQGDYMVLRYALNNDPNFRKTVSDIQTRGQIILKIGDRDIATFSRIADSSFELTDDEIVLKYRKMRSGIRFGIESFFFQEGRADHYQNSKYAELKVSENGEPVIVDLRPKFSK